ncbi:uncharacterized protein LOC128660068 isoform X2 [Bombina bombina]|uniref:uncharacterized protein LOC128660068 isoform X2 n=1 Tax=Bombina bombina TaxID=8345 RepID=UPI00235A9F57|nr:uncharacterized protein LOC128660068 isoform X2 [Bombina bombina]
MRSLILTGCFSLLLLALVSLSDLVNAQVPAERKLRNSTQTVATKRRGHGNQPLRSAQRGRKKSIWSYNPGHRSLAFLIAGEVVTSKPMDLGPDNHCLGCCGQGGVVRGRNNTDSNIENRLGESVTRVWDMEDFGGEPNSINGRCLGCCEERTTLPPEASLGTRAVSKKFIRRMMDRKRIVQQHNTRQRSYEDSSSSEED